MVTETRPQEFRNAVATIAEGEPANFAMTIARMLAAARLNPVGVDGVTHFVDQNRELTKSDWLAMLDVLAKDWKRDHGRAESPFEHPAERAPTTPGALERLRRLVLDWVAADPSPIVPNWLLQSTLDLARPRDFFATTLDSEAVELIGDALGISAKTEVFCAYEMSASVALHIAAVFGAKVTLDVEQRNLAALCACLGIAAGSRFRVRQGDPLKLAQSELTAAPLLSDIESYDVSIVIPPFGARRGSEEATLGTGLPSPSSAEGAGVTLALARGRRVAACLLSNSFLFKATKADQIFKDRAIRDFGLDAVVALPRGTFSGSPVSTALVVFRPGSGRTDKEILMIDARGERDRRASSHEEICELLQTRKRTDLSALVSFDEIAASDFNLSVERYVLEPAALRMRDLAAKATTVSLDDVAELYRPQALPKTPEESLGKGFFEVGAADIDEVGLVREPTKEVLFTQDFAQPARRARLENGDILLVIKGSVGKVGFVRDVPNDATWLASQSFVVLRLRRHGPLSEPRVLHRFLSSDLGQTTLQSLRVGTTVPGLQMADVRRLQIVIPSAEEQKLIGAEVEALFELQDRIREMREQLVARQHRIWPDSGTGTSGGYARASPKGDKRKSALPSSKRKTAS
jgi:type I restriction enzyme M protein